MLIKEYLSCYPDCIPYAAGATASLVLIVWQECVCYLVILMRVEVLSIVDKMDVIISSVNQFHPLFTRDKCVVLFVSIDEMYEQCCQNILL